MRLKLYQVDAFAQAPFQGNPAAVVPLEYWLDDETLQAIAEENNLAETVYFVAEGDAFRIRWFTPELEMDLCGHATLASAHVLYQHLNYAGERIVFHSRSGDLAVTQSGELLVLDLPSRPPVPATCPEQMLEAIGGQVLEIHQARDVMLVYASEAEVQEIRPNQAMLNQFDLGTGGIIVTAKGERADFVSRFFTPNAQVFEDPVTGSAHCTLVPFWAERLGKTTLHARQISKRGGELFCRLRGDRVELGGRAITYLEGNIFLQP